MNCALVHLGLAVAYLDVIGIAGSRFVQRGRSSVMPLAGGRGAWGPDAGTPDRTRPLASAHPQSGQATGASLRLAGMAGRAPLLQTWSRKLWLA
jgi:hypothetical protein